MALYGHEIDASISPLEADLGWIVKLDKGDFIGRDALLKQKERGITRKLIGFEMRGRGIAPRRLRSAASTAPPPAGSPAARPSPDPEQEHRTLLPARRNTRRPGTAIQVMIRNQPVDAVTVATPFYKRAK